MPLDVDSLLGELDDPSAEPFDGLPDGTRMGHVHLKVASIPETRGVLSRHARLRPHGAARRPGGIPLGAGGYHHHIGANTWESAGGAPPPPGAAALRHATIVFANAGERERAVSRLEQAGIEVGERDGAPSTSDPSGNTLVLAVP